MFEFLVIKILLVHCLPENNSANGFINYYFFMKFLLLISLTTSINISLLIDYYLYYQNL